MAKKIAFLLMTLAVVVSSCSDYETYGDKKDKERNAISKYISDHGITVISEDQFNKQGHTTDVSKNEFVKFDRNGVYLQIVRQGCGSELEDGGRGTLVCRFAETNMFADSVQTCNNTPGYAATPDRMFISRATSSLWRDSACRMAGADALYQGRPSYVGERDVLEGASDCAAYPGTCLFVE